MNHVMPNSGYTSEHLVNILCYSNNSHKAATSTHIMFYDKSSIKVT